jgi:hypothetical protein
MDHPHGERESGIKAIPTDDIERGDGPKPIVGAKFLQVKTDKAPKEFTENHIKKFIILGASLICIISIIIIVNSLQWNNNIVDDTKYKKKDIYNENYSEELSGNMEVFSSYEPIRKCSDYDYGCCNIYDSCSINGDELIYNENQISPYRIIAKDKMKSNCPSLMNILTDYIHTHLDSEDCSISEYGCCKIDFGCDRSVRLTKINPSDMGAIIKGFQMDEKKDRIILPLYIKKKDINGSNCPGIGDIIRNYEKEKTNHGGQFIGVVVICILICFIISAIISCCKFIFKEK